MRGKLTKDLPGQVSITKKLTIIMIFFLYIKLRSEFKKNKINLDLIFVIELSKLFYFDRLTCKYNFSC